MSIYWKGKGYYAFDNDGKVVKTTPALGRWFGQVMKLHAAVVEGKLPTIQAVSSTEPEEETYKYTLSWGILGCLPDGIIQGNNKREMVMGVMDDFDLPKYGRLAKAIIYNGIGFRHETEHDLMCFSLVEN